jgi:hypothetical protein
VRFGIFGGVSSDLRKMGTQFHADNIIGKEQGIGPMNLCRGRYKPKYKEKYGDNCRNRFKWGDHKNVF